MHINLNRSGLYVLFNYSEGSIPARGFVIKRASCRMFSEREGRWRGIVIGPLYFRTYERRTGQ